MPKLSAAEFRRRLRRVRLFATDVDGVLTDGGILVLNSGEEVKIWNVKDRIAFFILKRFRNRFSTAWITGRRSRQVAERAREVGVSALHQKCDHKGLALEKTLAARGLPAEESLFIGDDLVDLPALRRAGLAVCPSDAHPAVRKICHWVTRAPGGRGVFREVVDRVLEAQGLARDVLEHFENPARRPNP